MQPGRLGLDPISDEDEARNAKDLREEYLRSGRTDKWSGFARQDFPTISAATPPTCPVTCEACRDQFLPQFSDGISDCFPMRMHDDEQAASLITDLIINIKENHAYVRSKIEMYGTAIAKRWNKKTVTKRAQLLQCVKPGLYPKKRALIELMFEYNDYVNATSLGLNTHMSPEERLTKHLKHQDTYLAPFLDIESLSEEPLRLLALMHYRTHSDLSDWVLFDREQCKIGFHTCSIQLAYNPHCVITYGENIGKLIQWEKDAAHRGDMIGSPCARIIFKAQLKISEFLRAMMDILLEHEIGNASKGREEWDKLVASAFKQKKSFIGKSAYCEQAFSPAPKFDAKHIYELFRPRLDAAADELWQMQTDPIYVRHVLDRALLPEHHRRLKKPEQQDKLSTIPLRCILRTEIWTCLLCAADLALTLQRFLAAEIEPGKPLPKYYEMALLRFELHLKNIFDLQVRLLTNFLVRLPAFKQHVKYEAGDTYRVLTLPKDSFRKDPLFWNLSELKEYYHPLNPSASSYFTWIDEILSSASEMNRIDQELHDHLSDMAAVDEALSAIKFHKSHEGLSRSPKRYNKDRRDAALSEDIGMLSVNFQWCLPGAERTQKAFRPFMNLPLPSKTINRTTLTENQLLHDALSSYWSEVRVEMKDRLSKFPDPSERFMTLPITRISASLSKEYYETVEKERAALLKEIEAEERRAEISKSQNRDSPPLAIRQLCPIASEGDANDTIPKPKVKVKSRTVASSNSLNGIAEERVHSDHESDETTPAHIAVHTKYLPLFNNMFSSSLSSKGYAKWDTLVGALVDAGCSATHNGGSAVTFVDERHNKGSINLHEPHPNSTYHQIMLRNVGKRLQKRFGWNKDTFVERSKD